MDETILRTGEQDTAQLLSRLGSLPPAERLVAEAVLAKPIESMRGSIGELATRSSTSPATVIRLARRLGYSGFADWKIALAEQAGRSSQFGHVTVPTGAPTESAVHYTLAADSESLRTAGHFIDNVAFSAAVEQITLASEIMFIGAGTSGALAQLAAYRFSALGIRAHAISDTLHQHLAAANIGSRSVVIAISHTGSTKTTIRAATTAQERGAVVVGIVSSAKSPLAETANLVLVTAGDQGPEQDVFANRVVHLSLLGALHTAAGIALGTPEEGTKAAKIIATYQY
ncbi:MAG: MurR/RpiR family transcriptional regulator [Actinobacteria bacterium]|nr:MurR/RpiR family transcriptional regulator [Actinomycetota bacterium]